MQDPDCFCDLVALDALGLLSEEQQQWLAAELDQIPELEPERQELQTAAALLAYTVSQVDPPPNLKQRLFSQLNIPLSASAAPPPAPASEPPSQLTVRPQQLVWRPYHSPGVSVAVLHLDRATKMVSAIVRAEPGATYPRHRHADVEEILMLEGDLIFGDAHYGPGDYLRSQPNSIHVAAQTVGGCRFFVRTSLADELLQATTVG